MLNKMKLSHKVLILPVVAALGFVLVIAIVLIGTTRAHSVRDSIRSGEIHRVVASQNDATWAHFETELDRADAIERSAVRTAAIVVVANEVKELARETAVQLGHMAADLESTLDIDMPELDGMETLSRIRADFPEVDTIMVSNLTQRGARVTVDALFLGAADYVTKATQTSSPEAARAHLKDQLIPKIRALYLGRQGGTTPPRVGMDSTGQATPDRARRVGIVAIGASPGGPNDLADVLNTIPKGLIAPVVIFQHMPKNFTAYLADRLNSRCALTVREAEDGTVLTPGDAWIAPGDLHIKVRRSGLVTQIVTDNGALVNSCRPSVDVLFRSVAKCFDSSALAVVLTGMGQDGLEGSRAIAAAGGRIVVQDQSSSVVWGMPGHVANAGLADAVLPCIDIGPEIVRRVGFRT